MKLETNSMRERYNKTLFGKKKIYFTLIYLLVFCAMSLQANSLYADEPLTENKIYVVFRNDDLSATSDVEHEKKVMQYFKAHHIRQTFGVIPNIAQECNGANCKKYTLLSENPAMLDLLKEWQNDGLIEIALHGYTHEDNALNKEVMSEFKGLPYAEQFNRISKGKQLLEMWFQPPVTTFIFPWNTSDENTIKAASAAGMKLVSSVNSTIDHNSIRMINKKIILERNTVDLDEMDDAGQESISRLDKFNPVLASARDFIKKTKKPVLISALYHSWMIKLPESFYILDEIIKEISQSKDITVVTLDELAINFPEISRDVYAARREAKGAIQKSEALFSLIGRENPVTLEKGFVVLDKNHYVNAQNRAVSLTKKFYFIGFIITVLICGVYLSLIRLRLVKKEVALILMVLGIVIYTVLFLTGHFGLFGLDAGIGTIDTVVLLFLGIVISGLMLGHFLLHKSIKLASEGL